MFKKYTELKVSQYTILRRWRNVILHQKIVDLEKKEYADHKWIRIGKRQINVVKKYKTVQL